MSKLSTELKDKNGIILHPGDFILTRDFITYKILAYPHWDRDSWFVTCESLSYTLGYKPKLRLNDIVNHSYKINPETVKF